MEAKKAGSDQNSPGFRAAIEKAKADNMPNDNIARAIKKATGESSQMEAITYECYGPGGSALIIGALTDNRNKASQEVKHTLSLHGFSLANPGSALWAFEKTADGWAPKSIISISDEDAKKLEALVANLKESDEVQDIFTNAG